MKFILYKLLSQLTTVVLSVIAGYLAFHDRHGWGCFCGLALLSLLIEGGRIISISTDEDVK